MASVTLLSLRDEVYRRLGDGGYFRTPSAPTFPIGANAAGRNASVDAAVNAAIRSLVQEADSHGAVFLIASSELKDYYSQVVTITGSPTGGTFTLSMGHATSAVIAYNATAATVQTALEAICVSPATLAVSGSAGGPWTALWAVDTTVENIPCMRADGTELTGGTDPDASVAGTVSTANKREYDTDMYLLDSSYAPNYESDLFVLRTDTTDPVPMLWPEGGDYRMREALECAGLNPRWDYPPMGSSEGAWLYIRGKYIGHTSVPTCSMTLTCYYRPQVPGLSGDTATLHAAGLTFLSDWRSLIETMAAQTVAEDAGLDALKIGALQSRADRGRMSYVQRLREKRHPVERRLEAGWIG